MYEALLPVVKEGLVENSIKEKALSNIDKHLTTDVRGLEKGLENKNQIKEIQTRNQDFEGTTHPETGVPFIRKIVEDFFGNKFSGVFADFSKYIKFRVQLPENLLQASDDIQFRYCNNQMRDAFNKGKIPTEKFSDRQIEQIKNGDKPEGLTWHHNEDKGVLELIDSKIHNATGHTGGRSIWGGGENAR